MFDFLTQKFSGILKSLTGQNRLTQQNLKPVLKQIEDSLLQADVPYETVETFLREIEQEVVGQKVISSLNPSEQFIKIVHDRMLAFLGGKYLQDSFYFQIPSVIMMMGLQGSGKTTSVGKLAFFIQKEAQKHKKTRKILCASVDFYRPAALEQLEVVAKQAGIDFYKSPHTDPIIAAGDILNFYKQHSYDHLLFDTAGRLHIDDAMMQELEQVKKIIKPQYSFMVIDGMTGQQSLTVAQSFDKSVGFDGAVLSKMDSDTRGGVAFAFRYALKKPIYFMGMGEKVEQLEIFRPERIVQRMLGMGDLSTLMERAQEKIKQSEQEQMARAMLSGNMTLDDFGKQLSMMSQLGSVSSLLKFLPGMAQVKISSQELEKGEQELKKFRAILSSMTRKERLSPAILDGSRKKRVAQGAGVKIENVNQLLQKFEESKQFVKLLKNNRFFK